jgi:hypothetical protein
MSTFHKTVPFAWDTIKNIGKSFPLGNDQIGKAIPLGFSFRFFGDVFTHAYPSSEGFLALLPGQPLGHKPGRSVKAYVAALWQNLQPAG